MTRLELYRAMEHEKIILYDEFLAHLERTPLAELTARWAGVQELAKEHEPRKHRADWLAMFMWNSTALTVGEDELARRETERKHGDARKGQEERKRRKEAVRQVLSCKKISFWRLCSEQDRKQLVDHFLPSRDAFFQEYVRKYFLPDLSAMSDQMVLLWFWYALPPFSLDAMRNETSFVQAA